METVTPAAPAAPEVPVTPAVDPNVTATPEPEVKPERTFSQAEMDAAIEKRLAKERRKRTEIETRAKVMEELALKNSRTPESQQRNQEPTGEPKRDQYDSYEAFIEAKAEWKAEQKVEARFKERDTASQKEKQEAEHRKSAEEFRKRTKELAKGLDDFDEVMAEATSDPESPVSRIFVDPVQECENPAAVLYHLAKNPDEAERIAALSGHKQAREIWALDARLKSEPAAKRPSSAPAPIAPVGGKSVNAGSEPDASKNPEAWIAWRNQSLRAKRTGK